MSFSEIFVWFETVPMLGLTNSVRQLRHLACRKVSMTTLSSIKTLVLVLFSW